ncbi:assimilatory nitrate reductase catalytic subunit [Azospirillum fermentarium]|uniref:nitrate reductase n=1 Tax=Azospirillum fermentarium TaxID=1233114 RepID=UPI002227FCB9|nr:nitrate reductase [Azospirillum fermentarium]MCW2246862.1 assimilatory nitrate reductase catalytic subunit [Azospirillum fermentarium]
MAEIRTTCPYCGVGCGVLADVAADGRMTVRGDPDHPANRGRLCSKGAALGETVGLAGRLLHPTLDGRRVTWDHATATLAAAITDAVERHGPESVAVYASGQLLTEDYYIANKLMKGFIGSGNIDTNSRLCMASTVAGHKRAFGADTVPGTYEDLEQADLVVLVGSNLAWCHPVLHQRLLAAKAARGTRIVVIDPRRTATCDAADLHLAIRPGSDVTLFNGLLACLAANGRIDTAFTGAHTTGMDAAVAAARADAPSPEAVAAACGVPAADLARFYALAAATPRMATVFSQGVNQSAHGTDKVNAILNVHLLTGRIGRPGMGPFSVTGQPNAMGGREVGGLANQLAAHMGFSPAEVDRVGRFWNAPRMATREGLKAVDLFRAVEDGRIRVLWIMGTNPAVSMPDAARLRGALSRCGFVAVSDGFADTDTARLARLVLPAALWGEKDGTVTNSDRTLSRQRATLPLPGEVRPDWRIVRDVAHALGHGPAFAYDGPAAIFREHAALSAFENNGTRDFDIGALAGIADAAYDALAPAPWPRPAGGQPVRRLFADGRFFTPDGKARLVPVATGGLARAVDDAFPVLLNTGRARDQWHTMTRTGLSPRLSAHAPEPCLDVHPADAARWGLTDGGFVRIATRAGMAVTRVAVKDGQRPGEAFLPMHWNDGFTADCAVGRLIDAVPDPVSGQPELKAMPVRLEPVAVRWMGCLMTAAPVTPRHGGYWARQTVEGGSLLTIAGEGAIPDAAAIDALLPGLPAGCETLEYGDSRRGVLRRAWVDGTRLAGCLFIAAEGALPPQSWLLRLLAGEPLEPAARLAVLSGRAPGAVGDDGKIVCSCFRVGFNRLVSAIRGQSLTSVEAIGAALKAGTNCGSCIPELKEVLAHAQRAAVA